ncbi:MAG: PAS domain S-box protein [Nitrospirota bacterium]|jgi:diguanylate cyclase (GGDEF)-like protein/PAS domain S-box-containing protein
MMEDAKKTKEQLISELAELRKRVASLEDKDYEHRSIFEDFIRERVRHKRIVEDLPDLICRYKPDTTITFVNEAYANYFGKSVEDLIGNSFLELVPPDACEYVKKKIASLDINSPVVTMEHQVITDDGQSRWQLWRDRALFDESGKLVEIQAIGQDITERKQAEEALRKSEEKFRQMAENIREVFWLFDWEEQKVIYVSPSYEDIWGRPAQDLYDRYDEWAASIHPEDLDFARESFEKVLHSGGGEERHYRIVRPDGTVRWISDKAYAIYDGDGKIFRIAGTAEDITERKLMEEELKALSLKDELTGLYNRRGFSALAKQQLKMANRLKRGIFILYADIDNLKQINDTFGHNEGDRVLIETSDILKNNFRDSDIIARISGDEFVIIPVGAAGDNIEVVTARLQECIDAHNENNLRGYKISLSAGLAYYDPENPVSVDELTLQADKAMYEQKRRKQRL